MNVGRSAATLRKGSCWRSLKTRSRKDTFKKRQFKKRIVSLHWVTSLLCVTVNVTAVRPEETSSILNYPLHVCGNFSISILFPSSAGRKSFESFPKLILQRERSQAPIDSSMSHIFPGSNFVCGGLFKRRGQYLPGIASDRLLTLYSTGKSKREVPSSHVNRCVLYRCIPWTPQTSGSPPTSPVFDIELQGPFRAPTTSEQREQPREVKP